MKRASTRTGKQLIGKLIKSKKNDFIHICYELLELFYSDLNIDYDLGVIMQRDSKGYNLFYCLAIDNRVVIEDFNSSDIDKIFNEFQNIYHITILYNKNLIDEELRDASREFILNIHAKYGLSSLESFSPTAFVENIFSKARDVLYETIDGANEKFKVEFQERLSQEKIYIEDVPFLSEQKRKYNPKNHIYGNYIDNQDSSAKSWTFVISEFGFGKTSLLVNLPTVEKIYKYIYIPIAQFNSNSFGNETELAKSILEIIFNKTMDTKNKVIDKILVTEFRQLLRFHKDIVLLYDGLDEYRLAYTENGLKQIFTCSTSFVCNSIFTVRKEFIDERSGNFELALGIQPKPKYSSIYLLEWNNREILAYTQELKSTFSTNEEKLKYLLEFEKLVKRNKYHEEYGDIPRRPLFLKMLCDDIMSGDSKIKNIAKLYESYLTKKFILDREGSVLSANSARPLSKSGDIYSVTDYIFELLAKVAWKMLTINGIQGIYNESIDEKSILELMRIEYAQMNEIIELLLNSVLIPFDKRKRRIFRIKFAHKSFQEYFLAYYLIFVIFEKESLNMSALMLQYSRGTMDFCKYMVIEVDGLQDKIDELYQNINFDIDANALLYRLASVDAHIKKEELISSQVAIDKRDREEYDFFISHSSKDKIPFVENLVDELNNLGLKVFYDKKSIDSADNIVWEINEGFGNLKYGVIVILSPNFIDSNWCNEELAISFSLKVEKNKQLIPILLNISHDEIEEHYSILRAIKSIDAVTQHVTSVAREINLIKDSK